MKDLSESAGRQGALDGVGQVLLQKVHWGGDHFSPTQASDQTEQIIRIAESAHDPYLEVKGKLQLSALAWKPGSADQGRTYA